MVCALCQSDVKQYGSATMPPNWELNLAIRLAAPTQLQYVVREQRHQRAQDAGRQVNSTLLACQATLAALTRKEMQNAGFR